MGRIRLAVSALAVSSAGALVFWLSSDAPHDPSEAALEFSAEGPAQTQETSARALPDSIVQPTQRAEQRASEESVAGPDALAAESSLRRSLLILDEDGVTPRPGFGVRVMLGRRDATGSEDSYMIGVNAELTTDEEGLLDLDETLAKANGSPLLRCFPSIEMGLVLQPWEFPWRQVSTDLLHPTALTLAPRALSPVRALVLNAATQEPLAFFPLRLKRWVQLNTDQTVEGVYSRGFSVPYRYFSNEESEWVITDQEGRFTTEMHLPSGLVGFVTLGQNWAGLRWDVEQAPEQVMKVEVGPRVLLDFAPAGGRSHEDYIATVWRAPLELLGEGGVRECPSPWSPKNEENLGNWGNAVSVQVNETPYVQLTAEQAETPLPSSFLLLSRDGVSSGFVHVDSLEPYREVPLHVPLFDRGQLTCQVMWPTEFYNSPRLSMQLESLAEDSTGSWTQRASRENGVAQTKVQFQALDPGPYRLTLNSKEYEPATFEIQIPHRGDLQIHPRRVAKLESGKLIVQVRTDSGQALDGKDGRAFLQRIHGTSPDGSDRFSNGMLSWSEGVGRAELELPSPGSYLCTPKWSRGLLRTTPSPAIAQLPGADLVIRVHDTAPTIRTRVLLINPPERGVLILTASLDGTVIMSERSYFDSGDGEQVTEGEQVQRVFLSAPLLPELKFSVRLESQTHRLVELGDGAFSPPTGEDQVRSLVIHSRPGFGARFIVWQSRDSSGEERLRLPGVVLTLDGEPQAPTDERGQAMVSMDSVPTRLGVSTPGWKLLTRTSFDDWGSVYADTGKFTLEDGLLDVFLEATE